MHSGGCVWRFNLIYKKLFLRIEATHMCVCVWFNFCVSWQPRASISKRRRRNNKQTAALRAIPRVCVCVCVYGFKNNYRLIHTELINLWYWACMLRNHLLNQLIILRSKVNFHKSSLRYSPCFATHSKAVSFQFYTQSDPIRYNCGKNVCKMDPSNESPMKTFNLWYSS